MRIESPLGGPMFVCMCAVCTQVTLSNGGIYCVGSRRHSIASVRPVFSIMFATGAKKLLCLSLETAFHWCPHCSKA